MNTWTVTTWAFYNAAEADPHYERQEVTFTGLSEEQKDRILALSDDGLKFDAEAKEE
jgi:hypothetical protein